MTIELREQLEATLGSAYALERELGGAGMARVFVATEMPLGRAVVVKVLPPETTAAVSVERFRREVHLAAQLQHPHVVPLLSAGERDGLLYYTMPLVAGESLRERLAHGGELPVLDAVRLLREVADAVAYAHRHGVVHRDLKPDNILLEEGHALVTDFGVAKALAASADGASTLTSAGIALGTPAYMAPEQAAADPQADHRADLYALGLIAYEMLTGSPPFVGRPVHALLAAHATERPEPVDRRRPGLPPTLAELVMRLLEKRPADRPQSAEEVLRVLDGISLTPLGSPARATGSGPAPGAAPRRGPPPVATWALVALVAASTAVLAALLATLRGGPLRRSGGGDALAHRWSIVLPDSGPLTFLGAASLSLERPALAVSPDGSLIVYVMGSASGTRLALRRPDRLAVEPLPGTEGAFQPFFSPDGRWVAFFAGSELRKTSVAGGTPVTLARVVDPYGGLWMDDGRILLAERHGTELTFVPEAGGTPQPWPHRLQERTGLLRSLPGGWVLGSRGRTIHATSLETGEQRRLTRAGLVPLDSARHDDVLYGSSPQYLPCGHIVYAVPGGDGGLMALPFHAATRRATGTPVPVLQGMRQDGSIGAAQFAVSDRGLLVYAPGTNAAVTRLVLRSASGKTDTLPFPPAEYGEFKLSPDGRRIAARVWPAAAPVELWLLDLENGTSMRAPVDLGVAFLGGAWWPDGRSLVVGAVPRTAGGTDASLRIEPVGGGRVDTVVTARVVHAVSPDGRLLAVRTPPNADLSVVEAARPAARPTLIDPAGGFPSFSPDGRWVAFTSHRSGGSDVWVARVADPQDVQRVSLAGGEEPIWSARGDRIVFRNGHQWFGAGVTAGERLRIGRPRLLFEGPYPNVPGMSHDLTPDGRHHLLLLGPPETGTSVLHVVTNWFAEVQRLAPSRRP